MSARIEAHYMKRLTQEYVSLILDEGEESEAEHRRRIDHYCNKLAELGLTYDPVARGWIRSAEARLAA